MKRMFAVLLLVPVLVLANEFVDTVASGGGAYECRVNGELVSSHTSEYKASAKAIDLKLQHPDAAVVCDQHRSLVAVLTAAGRSLVSDAEAAVIVVSSDNFSYAPTHFVAPFADVGGTTPLNDEETYADASRGVQYANCTIISNPCTVAEALANAVAGDIIQAAPGTYSSAASSLLPGTFVGRFEFTNAGTENNPIVLTAQYPAAYNSGSPSLLSTFEQTYASGSEGLTDPIVALDKDYLRLDGFHVDAATSTPAANEGNFLITGSSTGCQITRSWVERAGEVIYTLDPNSATLFSHHSYNAIIADNRITGTLSEIQEDNDASIQAYKSDGLIIEHNYIDGAIGIYVKSDVSGGLPFLQDVIVRYNMVINATTFGFRTSTSRSTDVYNNVFHMSASNPSGMRAVEFDSQGVDTYDTPVNFYNNLVIFNSNGVAGFYLKGNRNIGGGEVHSNIFIDNSPAGGDLFRKQPIVADDIDALDRFNYNVWHDTAGSNPSWNYDYEGAGETNIANFTNVSPPGWQEYMATFGTSTVYTSETYEADSSYSDPQFVSADYVNPEDGDWALSSNAQDALTTSPAGGPAGPYISGNEEIGLRANPSY